MHPSLFSSLTSKQKNPAPPPATTRNAAGGRAYERDAEEALAQYAATSTLSDTFMAKASDQLAEVIALAAKCSSDVIADCAIYGRGANMKDTPALLVAILATRGAGSVEALARAFPRVVDNGRQVRTFVQMCRSGVLGRKSIPRPARTLLQAWFDRQSPDALYRASIGDKPSLADVVNMLHPKPRDPSQAALFRHLLGLDPKAGDLDVMPPLALAMAKFRASKAVDDMPADAPFMMTTAHVTTAEGWKAIAERATWTETRINLATFARHDVFKSPRHLRLVVARLTDRELIKRSRAMPYELLNAYLHADGLPPEVKNALQDALEISLDNVPALVGNTAIAVDVSGSMSTAHIGTSKVRCIDAASLFASALLRKNPTSALLPFDERVHGHDLNPRDSVVTNAAKLARYGGGGTACGAPIETLIRAGYGQRDYVDNVVMISDNESWADRHGGGSTGLSTSWHKLKQSNPRARLFCIDLAPTANRQATKRADTLNVGGFSDAVFGVVASFASREARSWLDVVHAGARPRADYVKADVDPLAEIAEALD